MGPCATAAFTILGARLADSLSEPTARAFLKKLEAHAEDGLTYDIEHTKAQGDIDSLMGVLALKGAVHDFERLHGKELPALRESLLRSVAEAWHYQT